MVVEGKTKVLIAPPPVQWNLSIVVTV